MVKATQSTPVRRWWKDGVVYQIWPASYMDSNGDGMGDITGIISTLSYLKDLGIDIIWVSPFYDSPQVDMGYDISNYEEIYAPYGTVADVDKLLAEAHSRGMRVIFDLVINHTSDQHAWFKESRSSKDSPNRDWYHWRPAKYNGNGERIPPNNWRSVVGGSSWEWDETTQEYYLHTFTTKQCDLNWDNEAARKAIYNTSMKFWLERGVDGFRIDTVNLYSKPPSFPDAPITDLEEPEFQNADNLVCNGPRIHEFLREMHDLCFSKYDCMTVGELSNVTDQHHALRYVSQSVRQLDMVFNFELANLGRGHRYHFETVPFDLPDVKRAINLWQTFVQLNSDAWTTVFMENHDVPRSVSKFCQNADLSDPAVHKQCSKLLALLLTTLTGTLFIYQGQEIGMVNLAEDVPISEFRDVGTLDYYEMITNRRYGSKEEKQAALSKARKGITAVARDHVRTPMQWSSAPHGGFTSPEATPWMNVNKSYGEINVEQQLGDANSILVFWRKMLKMRKEHADILVYGSFELYELEKRETFVYTKSFRGKRILVALNFSAETQNVNILTGITEGNLELLVRNAVTKERLANELGPWEGRVYLAK